MRELPFWMTPHQIYVYLSTGRGTARLDDAQHATRLEWQHEDDRANMIRRQGDLLQGGWQGTAGDGAFGAAQPLAESASRGADLLSRAEDLLDRQSGSFHRAANSVRPVPPEPPALDINDPNLPFTDYEKEVIVYQADAHHNIDVYSGYDGASEYNETNMPQEYETINHAGGDISVSSGDSSGDFIEVPDQGERSRTFGERGDPGGGPPPVSGPMQSSGPVTGPQQTSPSEFHPGGGDGSLPSGRPAPSGQPPSGQTPVGQPPVGMVPGLPVGFTGGGPGSTGGPGRTGGPGSMGGPGTTSGPGGRGGGPGPGSGPGPAVRGGLGAGPGIGALAAEEAAAQRAASAAAARGSGAGMVGGAPVGAGRGKGDEDEDHKRKVLIEADAEGIFGSDVLTAPEVIGDDEYEDD